MAGEKRAFPYYSSVPDINLKRRGIDGVDPGRESESAGLFELPDLEPSEAVSLTASLYEEGWFLSRACRFKLIMI